MKDQQREVPVLIEAHQLSQEALSGIIDDFVLRHATDYGANEVAHADKVDQVRRQILSGEVKIIFDSTAESVTLLTSWDFEKLSGGVVEDA